MSVLREPPVSLNAGPKPAPDLPTAGLLCLALTLLLLVSQPLPVHLYRTYVEAESYYAYGPAIPFLVAFLLWHRRQALREAPPHAQPVGARRSAARPGPADLGRR